MINIATWLKRRYERLCSRGVKTAPTADYRGVPEAARVKNPLSNKATFASCVYRRRGYMVQVAAKSLASIAPSETTLTPEREAFLENAWLRGVVWAPLVVQAVVEDDRWILTAGRNMDVALFLAGRQHMITLQILEPTDPPATKEKLHMLKAGLFTRSGKRCPVLFARVTY